MLKRFFTTSVLVFTVGSIAEPLSAQSPTCNELGARLVAWHSIASQSRTYAIFQLPRGITQAEAVRIAANCRFPGRQAFLCQTETQSEWDAVKSRFGAALGGSAVENVWVGAGTSRTDGVVRWFLGNPPPAIDFQRWNAWAPNEPGRVANRDAVTFHALYPGFFNACRSTDRYTRFIVEFRPN